MAKVEKIFLATIIVAFTGLISSIKSSFSHTGHDHSKPQIEHQEKQSEVQKNINQKIKKTEKFSQSNEMGEDIHMNNKRLNPNHTQVSPKSQQLNLLPQSTELVFFLLLANPFLLYTLKRKMYQRESN